MHATIVIHSIEYLEEPVLNGSQFSANWLTICTGFTESFLRVHNCKIKSSFMKNISSFI